MKCLKLLSVFVCLTVLFVSNCSDVTFDNVLDAKGTSYIGDKLARPWPEDDPNGIACKYNPDCPDYVKDTVPPKITILGDNPAEIPYGDPDNLVAKLKEQVKAYDDWEKKDYTKEISTTTNVAIYEDGEYEIVYEASDKSGNKATKTRKVIVKPKDIIVKNTQPSIFGDTINGKITIAQGKEFVISNYFDASDRQDTDLGKNDLKIKGKYNTDEPGEYKLTVYVTDSGNLTAELSFTLVVEKKVEGNNEPPVLKLKGDTLIEGLNSLEEFKEPGYTVDDPDGDNDKITVNIKTDESLGSTIYIIYEATDERGAKSEKLKRTLKINTGDPIITVKLANGQLVTNDEITILTRSEFKYQVSATDADGKEISSSKIQIKDSVTTTKAGTYTLEITAIDDNDRGTVRTITVHVKDQDKKPPVITIEDDRFNDEDKKEIIRYSDDTEEFEVPKATAFDKEEDRDLTDSIVVKGADKVELDKEGTYKISYTVSDTSGNIASDTVKVIIKLPTSKFLDKYGAPGPKITSLQGNYTFSKIEGNNVPSNLKLKSTNISMGAPNGAFSIWAFNINDTNGFDDLQNKVKKNTLASDHPTFTIEGANSKELDNTYYLVVDGNKMYWVQEDGDFAIIWEK